MANYLGLLKTWTGRAYIMLEELVLTKHAGQSQVVGRMSGDAGAFPESVGNTLITPDRTTIQVRSSG